MSMSGVNDADHYNGALLEDMNHKFDIILDYLAPLASLSGDVAQLKDDMVDVKADTEAIKLAVKHQADEHNDLVKQMGRRWSKRQ